MVTANNFIPILDVYLLCRLGAIQTKALTPLNGKSDELPVLVGDREHFLAFLGFDGVPDGLSPHLPSLFLFADGTYMTHPILNDLLAIGTQLLLPLRAFVAHESFACTALWVLLARLYLTCA